MTGDRDLPMLTVKEAVGATQTSESTVKRRLRAGAFPNAVQTADGKWMIPLGDLSAAGLRPGKIAKPDPVTPPADLARDLAAENAELRQRLAVAEALAGERNRIIEVQQQMLRMLEAKPAPAPAAPTPPAQVSATDAAQSGAQSPTSVRGWLRRRFAG